MEVSAVLPNYLFSCYQNIKPLLLRAVDTSNGRYSLNDLVKEICEGGQQLWICYDSDPIEYHSICTTSIVEYPGCKLLRIVYASGHDMDSWRDPLLDVLERFALDNGCSGLEMIGRKGWEKVLRGRRWSVESQIYRMDLGEQR